MSGWYACCLTRHNLAALGASDSDFIVEYRVQTDGLEKVWCVWSGVDVTALAASLDEALAIAHRLALSAETRAWLLSEGALIPVDLAVPPVAAV